MPTKTTARPVKIYRSRATKFDPALYTAITTDRSRRVGIAELQTLLGGDIYSEAGIFKWRRRTELDGGYGPVALPAPDVTISRGVGVSPIRLWFLGDLVKWLIQTGRMSMITFKGQKPRQAGRGRHQ